MWLAGCALLVFGVRVLNIKSLIGMVVAIGLITALGIFMLHYDNIRSRQIDAPTPSEMPTAIEASTSDGEITREDMYIDGKLDINKADAAALETLPGIGPALAKRIITYRETHPFKVTRDLKKVSGIGDAVYTAIFDYICVGDFESH